MTPEALAALHARCFPARPWSATELQDLMQARGMIWRVSPDEDGFVFAQSVPPEAEILTIAVAPEARRKGVARALMADLLAALPAAGITELFLEVADDNAPARALYGAIGFETAGRRKGYYPRTEGPASDALILHKTLA